ncbi:hypothetical protein ACFUGD_01215 [Streptomyces sp. NPDC057217]|uniref:hypothetical protein n=1 Tax=Streptomyces sp. NPDC057217 TaxID=3346054 RepID=UPI0036360D5D
MRKWWKRKPPAVHTPAPVRLVDVEAPEIYIHTGLLIGNVASWLHHRGYQAVETRGGMLFAYPGRPARIAEWGDTLVDISGTVVLRRRGD